MIISDLQHIESATETKVQGGGGWHRPRPRPKPVGIGWERSAGFAAKQVVLTTEVTATCQEQKLLEAAL